MKKLSDSVGDASKSAEASVSGTRALRRPGPLVEAVAAFALVTLLVALLYRLRGSAFVERNLAVIAAVLFLYVPAALLWRRGRDLDQYGLRLRPLGRGLGSYALAVALVLPLFSLGYWLFVVRICPWAGRLLVGAGGVTPSPGRALLGLWRGLGLLGLRCPPSLSASLRLPPELVMSALSQLLVVALPEEFFFRGFVLGRLGEVMSGPRALLLSSLLFALGHFLVRFEPATLAVFFPGLLFGLLRLYTGSVLAGTLFHATCNLLIETLHRSLG